MTASSGPPPPPPPPPPPAATGASLLTCPNCKSTAPAGTRFCPNCGSALAAAPPGPGAPVDLRQKVDSDRGTLKRLQLLIPGFRGYRLGEDLREADSLLRTQVANKLVTALARIQKVRESLTQAYQYGSLNDLALVISDLNVLEGRIRHAEQGYTGISASIRVRPNDLDRLYEYDYGFAEAADQLNNEIAPLESAAAGNNGEQVKSEVARLRGLLGQLRSSFEARMTTIEGIRV